MVTSGANGAAELFRGAGCVVEDPERVEGFAEALEALAEPDLRRRLGEAARSVAAAHGWDAHLASLRALFAEASASEARSEPQASGGGGAGSARAVPARPA